MSKSKSAKHRKQLTAAYFSKAAAAEKPPVEKAIVLIALDFALSASPQKAESEMGLSVKTLLKLQKGHPYNKTQEDCIMRGAEAMGFALTPA